MSTSSNHQSIIARMAHQPRSDVVRDVIGAVLCIDPNSKNATYYVNPVTWPVLVPRTRALLIAEWITAETIEFFDEPRPHPDRASRASANPVG